MNPPKGLKPDKGVEENTERLLNEKIELPEVEEDTSEELKDVQRLVEIAGNKDGVRAELQSKIDPLLAQNGYSEVKVKVKKPFCEYYAKKTDLDFHKVFIKRWEKNERGHYYVQTYGYADVKPGRLEEFCKRYDLKERSEVNNATTFSGLAYMTGMMGGGFLGCLGEKIYSAFEADIPNLGGKVDYVIQTMTNLNQLVVPRTMMVGFTATVAGICVGSLVYPAIKQAKNKKKLRGCYNYLTHNEVDAVKVTFG